MNESLNALIARLSMLVDDRISKGAPFRAIVKGFSSGLVTIRRLEASSNDSELYARVYGFTLAVDDEVLCLPTSGKPVIIGRIQRTAGYPSATVEWLQFNLTPTVTPAEGMLYWDQDLDVLNLRLNDDVDHHIGQQLFMPPTNNNSGATIPAGAFVMATGVQGDRITIAKAVTNGSVDPMYMIGIAAHEILNGDTDGKILVHGEARKINTSAWAVGTVLYPDPATAGGLTSTKPSAPNIRTAIGYVLRQHANTGRIMVRMDIGSTLGGTDSNVAFSSLADGDLVTYDATAGVWVNAQPTGGGGIPTLSPNGIVVQSASTPSYVSRSIAGTTNQIAITNGDGVSGDPTVAISRDPQITGDLTLNSDATTIIPTLKIAGSASATGRIGELQVYRGATLAGELLVLDTGTTDLHAYVVSGSNPDIRIFSHGATGKIKIIPANEVAGEAFVFEADTTSTGSYGVWQFITSKASNTAGGRIVHTGGAGLAIDATAGFLKLGSASAVPVTISQAGQTTTVAGALAVNGNTTLGDASGDTVTVNAGTVTMPANSLNLTAINDATIQALGAYNTNGLITQTAADTFTGRTVTGTSNQITVTNGSGVSGNPTISLPSAITAPGSLDVTGKLYAQTGEPVAILDAARTSSVTHTSLAQLTVVTGGSYALPAGSIVRAKVWGYYGYVSSAQGLDIMLYQGTNLMITLTISTIVSQANSTANPFWAEFEANIITTTTANCVGRVMAVNTGDAQGDTYANRIVIANGQTISSTATGWTIQLDWPVNTGSSVTVNGGYVEYLIE